MPFIVTTKPGCDCGYCADPDAHRRPCSSRRWVVRAVATLEEARTLAYDAIGACVDPRTDGSLGFTRAVDRMTESGGTVGPLPDGTVIEVKPTTYVHLACDGDWQWPQDDTDYSSPARHGVEVLAAFNAKQAT